MQAHIIENGVVINTIMVPDLSWPVAEGQTLIDGSTGSVGWTYVDGQLHAPVSRIPVPESIPALDGMLTLISVGLGESYQAWAASPERSFVERAFIDKAMTWKRDDPAILAAADALGLTGEQIDDLFIQAASI